METELKTLKDLNLGYEGHTPEDERIRKKLRTEAIKWMNGMDKAKFKSGDNYETHKERLKGFEDFYDDEYDSFDEVINFIKHFFNITEEDLMEGIEPEDLV